MSRHLVEELSGVGTVYAGEQLLRTTSYRLSVWGESPPGGDEAPAATIEGLIDITGIGEAIVLAGPSTLTLLLEDGRRLAFTLVGTSGRIIGRGGLQPSTAQE
jgi:hypothetical protein